MLETIWFCLVALTVAAYVKHYNRADQRGSADEPHSVSNVGQRVHGHTSDYCLYANAARIVPELGSRLAADDTG
jgi:hypothetical protein